MLYNLIASIKNLREGIATDGSNVKVLLTASKMKRCSYIMDLEYKLVLALNYSDYPTDGESRYFETMVEYMEKFYD